MNMREREKRQMELRKDDELLSAAQRVVRERRGKPSKKLRLLIEEIEAEMYRNEHQMRLLRDAGS